MSSWEQHRSDNNSIVLQWMMVKIVWFVCVHHQHDYQIMNKPLYLHSAFLDAHRRFIVTKSQWSKMYNTNLKAIMNCNVGVYNKMKSGMHVKCWQYDFFLNVGRSDFWSRVWAATVNSVLQGSGKQLDFKIHTRRLLCLFLGSAVFWHFCEHGLFL